MVLQSKMENYDYMNWISYKQTPDRNFEIETAGLPKKLELKKMDPFIPIPFSGHFFFTCFGMFDPSPLAIKQEKKAMYTVYNEKHKARFTSCCFSSFLNSFFLFLLVSAFCI